MKNLILYVALATFIYAGVLTNKVVGKLHYWTSIVMLFAFTAFRNVNLGGYDALNYQNFFYSQVPVIWGFSQYNGPYGYGYAFLNSLIKSVGMDYRGYQVIYSIIAIILLISLINKLKLSNGEKSLFLFVFFCYQYLWNFFVLLRQNIAMLIFWIVLFSYFNKTIRSYVGIAVTWLWHRSSIVNIGIYTMLKMMMQISRRRMLTITFITSLVFLVFSHVVYNTLAQVFIFIAGPHFLYDIQVQGDVQGINFVNYLVKWGIVMIFYVQYEKIKNPHKKMLLYLSFFSLILGSVNVAIVQRFVDYYMISIYVMIAITHQAFTLKGKYLYIVGVYILFIVTLVRFLVTFTDGQLLHYTTFLF